MSPRWVAPALIGRYPWPMSDQPVPPALKVFFWSLAGAAGGTYGSFRLANFLLNRFLPRLDPVLGAVLLFLVPLAIGMASAVTAGVLAGKATRH